MPQKTRPRGRPPNPATLYREIQADLRRRLSAKEWPPGATLPSLEALARRYRVGKRTIALAVNALKSESWVAASPRHRLIACAPEPAILLEGHAVLEILAWPLGPGAVSGLDFRAMQLGILAGIGELKAPLMMVHEGELRTRMPERYLELSPRGVLLVGKFQSRLLKQYEKLGIPVVLCDIPGRNWGLHAVNVANAKIMSDTVQRLVTLGHRRIAFLRFIHYDLGAVDPDSKEREESFRQSMSRAGCKGAANWVYNSFSSDTPRSANIRRLLNFKPAFTAVIATDPVRAELVATGARELGIRIPEDLSVVCFQGKTALLPRCSGPRLDFEEMGRQAVLLLKEPRRPVQHVDIFAEWADGETLSHPRQ